MTGTVPDEAGGTGTVAYEAGGTGTVAYEVGGTRMGADEAGGTGTGEMRKEGQGTSADEATGTGNGAYEAEVQKEGRRLRAQHLTNLMCEMLKYLSCTLSLRKREITVSCACVLRLLLLPVGNLRNSFFSPRILIVLLA